MQAAFIEKETDVAKKITPRSLVKGKLSAAARKAREEFFRHKRQNPEPNKPEELTPLQKRQRSGGP